MNGDASYFGFTAEDESVFDMISDPSFFLNLGHETENDLAFVNTFYNHPNTHLDTANDATSFAGITHEVDPELEVIGSASSRFVLPIASRLHDVHHGNRITPVDDFATHALDIKELGTDQTKIVPARRGPDTSTPKRKPRRRRGMDMERLFTVGPNPYGCKGRKKCGNCRFHRVKCEFDEMNPDLPCKRCVLKRYVCGEKALGPKSHLVEEGKQDRVTIAASSPAVHRPLGTPSDQLLLPNDLFYLQFYDSAFRAMGFRETAVISGKHYVHYVCRLDFDITSIPFRAAILAFATLSMPRERHDIENVDAKIYSDIFYRSASEAVEKEDIASLMYASYIMATLSLRYETSTCHAMAHCAQFCRTLHPYSRRGLSWNERDWITDLWISIVRSAYIRYWFEHYDYGDRWYEYTDAFAGQNSSVMFNCPSMRRRDLPREFVAWSRLSNLNKLVEIIAISTEFAHSGVGHSPSTLRINTMYMQIYVERCLFDALDAQNTAASPFTEPLHSVFLQNIDLIENTSWLKPLDLLGDWLQCYDAISGTTLPDPISDLDLSFTGDSEDYYACNIDLVNIYICSRMLLQLLCSDLDHQKDDESEAYRSALGTVSFLSSTVNQLSNDPGYAALLRRSLFWAGLILYKEGHQQGKCIVQRIFASQLGFLKWPESRKQDSQKQFCRFMEAVEQCHTWDEIWSIEVEGVPLVHYALAFVPFSCRYMLGYLYAA